MRNRWVLLALALVVALTTAFSWGWMNRQRVDPYPAVWLDRDATVLIEGLEFSNPVLTTAAPPSDGLTQYPEGAVVATLTVDVEVVEPPAEEHGHYCILELQTPLGSYPDDKQFSSGAGLPYTCDTDPEGSPLTVGDSQTVTAAWIVPGPPPEGSWVLVRLPAGYEALGIRI